MESTALGPANPHALTAFLCRWSYINTWVWFLTFYRQQEPCDMLIHTKFQSFPQLNDMMCQHLSYCEVKTYLDKTLLVLTLIKIMKKKKDLENKQ